MKRELAYAFVGLFFWIIFYIMFLVSAAEAQETFFLFLKETIIIQLFILLLPGIIIALVFYDISSIKNKNLRKKSLLLSSVIIFLFLLAFRWLYL